MMQSLPSHVYHCDWGTAPKKRWKARAVRNEDGRFTASAASQVSDPGALVPSILREIGTMGSAMIGFDFPIGLPIFYARANRIHNFKSFALKLGDANWDRFFKVAERESEISLFRPFYPQRPGGTKHEYLLNALGVKVFDDLRRACEKATVTRKAACPLFWTLGANQVGKGALAGLKEVLVPAMKSPRAVRLWPFDGPLKTILAPGVIVIAETYPAEYYPWLFEKELKGKGKQSARKGVAASLLGWAARRRVTLDAALTSAIQDGFAEGDDAFDAVIGLFGMLEVILGGRTSGDPVENECREIEGWILGQEAFSNKSGSGSRGPGAL